MTEADYDVLEAAEVVSVYKCDGGAMVLGKVWELVKDDEGENWICKARLHVATSDAAVAKLVKDYLRKNIGNENGVLDEEDGG